MKRRLHFLIHDLGGGGAEAVLVRLVNRLDRTLFDVSVTVLFGGGVREADLAPDVRFRAVFPRTIPGNRVWMKLLSPAALHRLCVKGRHDALIAFLEGPSARVIAGCPDPDTALVAWIHSTVTADTFARSFRSRDEAVACYGRMDGLVCVSGGVRDAFEAASGLTGRAVILPNALDAPAIRRAAAAPAIPPLGGDRAGGDKTGGASPGGGASAVYRLCAVGTLKPGKGFDRLLRIMERLAADGVPARLYILGDGPLRRRLEAYARTHGLADSVTFLGYRPNPYPIIAACDLLVSASRAEGFSTAVAEALILGVPVVAADTSGMAELLGGDGACGGVIVPNDEAALYEAVRALCLDPARLGRLRRNAAERGRMFDGDRPVRAAEDAILRLIDRKAGQSAGGAPQPTPHAAVPPPPSQYRSSVGGPRPSPGKPRKRRRKKGKP